MMAVGREYLALSPSFLCFGGGGGLERVALSGGNGCCGFEGSLLWIPTTHARARG
jgi:hypothetical protein